ncbi:MBL fold metallo-hydrolase [Ramlibacter sp. USB13]|uniref:MBL fold metallo-hydrolase n=1 Tax=Ramlibacter cellulosilyticus TaxID=2764187 RepID=A0A923SBF8_9BURK|nr:MBL fold metallo-hydrolase [Ramlibacter cellulosilyticus]MBC5783851.1 MBL fold metallo-hydrolase [Ramlibacter cellulosilyticus]
MPRPSWKVLFALAAAFAIGSAAAQQAPRPVVPQQVSPSAWFVQGEAALGTPANRNFISNAGFVVTPAGVVVIDALGSPQLARELLAAIARITPQPVTHVVVTHYHADHVYGLQEFRKRGAKIVAQRGALEYLNSETASSRLAASRVDLAPWIDDKTELVVPDQWLDGPGELVVGGVRLLLRPVGPAHTPEDQVVLLPSERVLFAGDLVFRGRIPYVGQADSRHWIAALDELLKMDARIVVPGHGAMSTTAREDLELTRDYLVYLREAMGTAARDMEPFEDAYARADWSRFEHLPLFKAANRMNAYNTYLLMERQLK